MRDVYKRQGQQALPLLPGHVVDITTGELANGLQEAAGIKGSYIELPVVLSHSPDILIFPVTKARANTRDATFREHRRGISHHQLNILVFVPVSYTHLDVYKRQPLPSRSHWGSAC